MSHDDTTSIVQRYLDALPDESAAEPTVRALLEGAVSRLQVLCANMLYRNYPRLMQPPVALEPDDLLGGVVERLLKAMREIHPKTVRQFFALADQHIRWELNDLARRLDEHPVGQELNHESVLAPDTSGSGLSVEGRRMLEAIEKLPEDQREVFGLVRIQGLTHAEAAKIIGVSQKTVLRRLNRGLVLLAQQLDDLRPQ